MEFGDAFQLATTLEALRGRRRRGSLRRSWTDERVLRTCAAEGCDATFINKQRTPDLLRHTLSRPDELPQATRQPGEAAAVAVSSRRMSSTMQAASTQTSSGTMLT